MSNAKPNSIAGCVLMVELAETTTFGPLEASRLTSLVAHEPEI